MPLREVGVSRGTAVGRMKPESHTAAPRFFAIGLLCLVIAAVAYGTLQVTFGPRLVSIHVRWAPDVDDTIRQGLEQRYSLSEGALLQERTWGYTLSDSSRTNVRAPVSEAAIEDTQDIQRATFRVSDSAPRLPYPTSYPWIPVRLRGLSVLCLLIGLIGISLALVERAAPGRTATWFVSRPRGDVIFVLILLAALLLRLSVATTAEYVHDEENASIPTSQSISFAPGNLQLPIRAENHPALPAYFVKVSSVLFGTTPFGYRLLHVLASMCIIVMTFVLARQWYGLVAARWAAALLAFNEYFLGVSSRATAHVPYLLFAVAAVYAFGRFISTQRAVYLYAAGVALGLAFYAKELSALLLPVFLLVLLHRRHRHWFRSPHVYVACALFFSVIGPDLFWNLTSGENIEQATYGDHLQRIGGIGFSPYPFMFYARDATQWLHGLITGMELFDPTTEYLSVNPAIGALLLGAVLVTTCRRAAPDGTRFLLLLFWGVFGFFALIRPGDSPKDLDPASWIWVDVTLFPAVILAGSLLAGVKDRSRAWVWAFACGALLYASAWIVG